MIKAGERMQIARHEAAGAHLVAVRLRGCAEQQAGQECGGFDARCFHFCSCFHGGSKGLLRHEDHIGGHGERGVARIARHRNAALSPDEIAACLHFVGGHAIGIGFLARMLLAL